MKKPNRRRQQDAKGRRKRMMPVDGAGLRRIPGIQAERAKKLRGKSRGGKEDENKSE